MTAFTDLRDRLRRILGSPDTTDLPDATIEAYLTDDVLSWINFRRPSRAITYFETVANQQFYNEKPSNAYKVINVWWLDADFEYFSPAMRYMPNDLDVNEQIAGFSVIDNPALIAAFYKAINDYDRAFKGTGREYEDGRIMIEPYPANAGDRVYFEYTKPRWSAFHSGGVISIPAQYQEGCIYKAASLAFEHLAVKRGRVRNAKNFTSGGGQNELRLAEYYEDRANAQIPTRFSLTVG